MNPFMRKVRKNDSLVAMNLHHTFLMMYHRAVQTSQIQDYFDTVIAAKQLDYYIRNNMSFWQRIRYMWTVVILKDETFRWPSSNEILAEAKRK